MPPSTLAPWLKPLSGRHLSFMEREELAILHARDFGGRETGRLLGRSASNRKVRRRSTVSRKLRRNAATRSGGLEHWATTAQWHAERAARRPKPTTNAVLRSYVQDRLAGVVVAPGGAAVPGPFVPWKGRRHGPRQARRWASAWARSRSPSACGSTFPGTRSCGSAARPSTRRSTCKAGGNAPRTDGLPAHRAGAAGAHARPGQVPCRPEAMISQRPAEAADRAVPAKPHCGLRGAIGRGTSSWGWAVPRSARWWSARRDARCCCTCPG